MPDLALEKQLQREGYPLVAGIDDSQYVHSVSTEGYVRWFIDAGKRTLAARHFYFGLHDPRLRDFSCVAGQKIFFQYLKNKNGTVEFGQVDVATASDALRKRSRVAESLCIADSGHWCTRLRTR